jgi:hypothetical protein
MAAFVRCRYSQAAIHFKILRGGSMDGRVKPGHDMWD